MVQLREMEKRKFCVFRPAQYRYCPDVWTPFKYQRDPASRPTNSCRGIAICIGSVRATQPLSVITIHQTRFENAAVANSRRLGISCILEDHKSGTAREVRNSGKRRYVRFGEDCSVRNCKIAPLRNFSLTLPMRWQFDSTCSAGRRSGNWPSLSRTSLWSGATRGSRPQVGDFGWPPAFSNYFFGWPSG